MSDERRTSSRFDEAMDDAIRAEVEGDGGVGERRAARRPKRPIWLCRACHFGHFLSCEDERCESMKLEDRHE